jgi:hypothetical protein
MQEGMQEGIIYQDYSSSTNGIDMDIIKADVLMFGDTLQAMDGQVSASQPAQRANLR